MNRQKRFRWCMRILISLAFAPIYLLGFGTAEAKPLGNNQYLPNLPSANAGSLSELHHPLLQNPICPHLGDHQVYDGTDYTLGCSFFWGAGLFSPVDEDTAESVMMPAGWSMRLFKDDDIHSPHVCIRGNDPNLWDNFYNDGTVAANSASLYQVYDQPDCPPASQPNLIPSTPGGWDFPIVPSTLLGTTVVNNLYANENTYLDFAYANTGTFGTQAYFSTCLYTDGIELYCESNSLAQNVTDLNTDWQFPAWQPTQGWHVLKIITDVGNVIVESNEADNVWERNFYWEGESPFHKISPPPDFGNIAVVPTNPTLSWSSVSGATGYEYCYDTLSNTNCDSSWISTGLATSVGLVNLPPHTFLHWQVRAVAGSGATYADNNNWWIMSISDAGPPVPFNKTGPSNGAVGISTSPTLSWASSWRASEYQYCYDTSNNDACDGSWLTTTATSKVLPVLAKNTTFYWQVQAVNWTGATYADDGAWRSFTTWNAVPVAFYKTGPANGATRVSTSPTLTWTSSSEVTNYEYCYDTSNDDACASWVNAGTDTHASLSGLSHGATLYWQVRAVNGGGSTYADAGYDSFTIIDSLAGAFGKTGPTDGVTGELIRPTLRWQAADLATEYQYCYDASDDDACSNWISSGTNTSVELSGLTAATPYFWQVRATHGTSEPTYANGSPSAFWSFTTAPTPPPLILIPGLGGTRLGNDQGELWLGLEKMVDDACSLSHGLRATNEYLDVCGSTAAAPRRSCRATRTTPPWRRGGSWTRCSMRWSACSTGKATFPSTSP